MAYGLMALMAFRELYRHIAKMAGWLPRMNPIPNHLFNAVFALAALLVALGGLTGVAVLSTAGWLTLGVALLGGTTVPCGWAKVNNTPALWYPRQLFFLSLSVCAFAYALHAF